MFCFGTARNPDHNLCDCPILKNLGLRIEKRSTADNLDREAASCLAAAASPASGATPPLTNHPPPDNPAGVASVQGTFGASTSGDEFNYEGKVDGATYGRGGKSHFFSPSSRSRTKTLCAPPSPKTPMRGDIVAGGRAPTGSSLC